MKLLPLIDTNLLLLLVIGSVDNGTFIKASKRLKNFSYRDYRVLLDFIDENKNFATTPYILTEVSNLIDLDSSAEEEAYNSLRIVSENAEIINVVPKNDTNHKYFSHYGLTDVNILEIASTRPILTNDNRLSSFAYSLCPPDNIIPWCVLTAN